MRQLCFRLEVRQEDLRNTDLNLADKFNCLDKIETSPTVIVAGGLNIAKGKLRQLSVSRREYFQIEKTSVYNYKLILFTGSESRNSRMTRSAHALNTGLEVEVAFHCTGKYDLQRELQVNSQNIRLEPRNSQKHRALPYSSHLSLAQRQYQSCAQ